MNNTGEILIHNLDMIISVGYRIKSSTATQFRIWANHKTENMGLTSWKTDNIRKNDVKVVKNYLSEEEIDHLNRIVVMWLDYAEDEFSIYSDIRRKDIEDNAEKNYLSELENVAKSLYNGERR